MSTMQRIHARTTLTVGRDTAEVLRTEVKKVAMFEHETFEDFLDFCPEAQHSLSLRYRTIFDLIDTVGWNPGTLDPAKRRFKIALTEDLINLLTLRHEDLGRAVNDRLAEHQDPIPLEIQEEITTDQLARVALDQLFRTCDRRTQPEAPARFRVAQSCPRQLPATRNTAARRALSVAPMDATPRPTRGLAPVRVARVPQGHGRSREGSWWHEHRCACASACV